jgi:hypothetical protein
LLLRDSRWIRSIRSDIVWKPRSYGNSAKRIWTSSARENGYCESFNGKLRDECLNANRFSSLACASDALRVWRKVALSLGPGFRSDRPAPAIRVVLTTLDTLDFDRLEPEVERASRSLS